MALTNQQLKDLFVPEEERMYLNGVERFVDSIGRGVKTAAQSGKTIVSDIPFLSETDIMLTMVLKRLRDRFPEAKIGFDISEGSVVKRIYVDWT
jgi:hypothetical protein